ncbi:MAG TPA: DUF5985 family protein [Candidatus Aquilonibacter sp.]|nr:DUF5985 family protein [Candidatus Aquilonibacter sp.]
MYLFLNGVVAMGCFVAALFFGRMGKRTADRFFLLFAIAFWLLGLERLLLSWLNAPETTTPAIYLMRLAAFLCIIFAIVSKNVEGRAR